MAEKEKCLAVLRLRGNVNISRELEYVFKLMHLPRKNHLTLVRGSPSNLGMLRRIKDYATWGEASQETILQLLQERGFFKGNQRLNDEKVKEKLGYDSIEEMAKAIYELEANLWNMPELKPVFRLHPPRGGFHGTVKKPYPKGELGYRGEKINELTARMV